MPGQLHSAGRQWDPSRQAWLAEGDAAPELPPVQEHGRGHRRPRAAGVFAGVIPEVITAILDGISTSSS
jgi:hypothetical protein